jgi:hypothetical protein
MSAQGALADIHALRLTVRMDQGLIALEPRTVGAIRIRYRLAADWSRKPNVRMRVCSN